VYDVSPGVAVYFFAMKCAELEKRHATAVPVGRMRVRTTSTAIRGFFRLSNALAIVAAVLAFNGLRAR
jgi:hypothetical protein